MYQKGPERAFARTLFFSVYSSRRVATGGSQITTSGPTLPPLTIFVLYVKNVEPQTKFVPPNDCSSPKTEMLFSDSYLLRTRITFLTNYDLTVRTSVDSTDSTVNHHIKAVSSAFYVLGSLHFTYRGLTSATRYLLRIGIFSFYETMLE